MRKIDVVSKTTIDVGVTKIYHGNIMEKKNPWRVKEKSLYQEEYTSVSKHLELLLHLLL